MALKHIHFMGISGIGMSALAGIKFLCGYKISGCDKNPEAENLKLLIENNCKISASHDSEVCNNNSIELLVYTGAITKNHIELEKAKNKNIKIISRAELLAELMEEKFSIAITGSHGKTTTAALISYLMIQLKLDPTIIVGGILENFKSNFRLGKSNYLVTEADESDRTFLLYQKNIAIITNIDYEHLETYKDLDDIKNSYLEFINKTPADGKIIYYFEDKNLQTIMPKSKTNYISFGISNSANYQIKNIKYKKNYSEFSLFDKLKNLNYTRIKIPLLGFCNILNSVAAIATCLELNSDIKLIKKELLNFKGVDRRFTFKGKTNDSKFEIYDDYAHHPEEIKAALEMAKKTTKNKLIVIFQPHKYTRTKFLWTEFISVLSNPIIDKLIITDTYSSGEKPIENFSSKDLVDELKKISNNKICYCKFETDFKSILKQLNTINTKNSLLLLLGAGTVNKIANLLLI